MAAAKTVKVVANYPDVFVPVGDFQMLWGVSFEHVIVKQDGKELSVLHAEMDVDEAKVMAELNRVSKAL